MLNLRNIAATLIVLSAASVAGAQTAEQCWVDRYDGEGQGIGGTDRGFAVSIDSQGNTIVAGFSSETQGGSYLAIKYAPDGTRSWLSTSTTASGGLGRTMTVDDADNVIVVGSANGGHAFGIVKYGAAGNYLWSQTYDLDPLGAVTAFQGVGTDLTGAIYAYGNRNARSIVIVKYAADGTFLWDLEYSTPLSRATGIAVTDDAVYLVGNTEVANNDEDLLVLKVTPSGAVDWARTYGRSGSFAFDSAEDMALDASGNVVVAGTYSGNGNPEVTTDIAVVRIAPDGTLISEVAYDGPLETSEGGLNLVLDADGNAIVSGTTEDGAGNYNVLTVKLDPTGSEIWARTYPGAGTFTDTPTDMAIDHLGNIYVVGDILSPGFVDEYFTIMYDAAGTLQWEQLYGGSTYDPSHGMAIAVSADRRVAVTGYSGAFGPFGDSDVATVCYTWNQPTAVGVIPSNRLQVSAAPNPFNPRTTVSFTLDRSEPVLLDVLDVRGRRVRRLLDESMGSGHQDVVWNGLTDEGASAASGTYIFRILTASGESSAKGVLIK